MQAQDQQTFTIKANGQTRELKGNPSLLTLEDVLSEVGQQGGERWDRNAVKLKANGREFGETDLHRTFSSVGIQPGSMIEVIGPVTA